MGCFEWYVYRFRAYVKCRIGGSARPNANAKVLSAAVILQPSQPIQAAFVDVVKPLFASREQQPSQHQQLKAAGDHLLPRLMSGEVPV